ncbi:MAG: biotin/lipoyl-containing protein, partial [Saprospiraceae bacterium]
EELLEYAMHPNQYEAFRSGEAKKKFEADLAQRKATSNKTSSSAVAISNKGNNDMPKEMDLNVNGENYHVIIKYPSDNGSTQDNVIVNTPKLDFIPPSTSGPGIYITAPLEGKFYLTKESSEKGKKVGDIVKTGDVVGYIEAMKVINAITADKDGTIIEILAKHGEEIEEDDSIFKLS